MSPTLLNQHRKHWAMHKEVKLRGKLTAESQEDECPHAHQECDYRCHSVLQRRHAQAKQGDVRQRNRDYTESYTVWQHPEWFALPPILGSSCYGCTCMLICAALWPASTSTSRYCNAHTFSCLFRKTAVKCWFPAEVASRLTPTTAEVDHWRHHFCLENLGHHRQ